MELEQSTATSTPTDMSELVDALQELTAAFDQARTIGLPVTVPLPLYQACLAVIARHDDPDTIDGPSRSANTAADAENAGEPGTSSNRAGRKWRPSQDALQDVPLRKLVWRVIVPGEQFTVAEIGKRLSDLDVPAPANKISNTLGYWVSRGRLIRARKGVYLCPHTSILDESVQALDNEERHDRDALRREESIQDSDQRTRRKAV
jgi:hypothetical protein